MKNRFNKYNHNIKKRDRNGQVLKRNISQSIMYWIVCSKEDGSRRPLWIRCHKSFFNKRNKLGFSKLRQGNLSLSFLNLRKKSMKINLNL